MSPDQLKQSEAQYVAGDHIFEVKDKGAGLFPFVLDDNAYRFQFPDPARSSMAYLKAPAEYLVLLPKSY
jgi:hypothetical protein